MANMSYCRFRNTLTDLTDCFYALREGEAEADDLGDEEARAMRGLIELCSKIVDEFGDLLSPKPNPEPEREPAMTNIEIQKQLHERVDHIAAALSSVHDAVDDDNPNLVATLVKMLDKIAAAMVEAGLDEILDACPHCFAPIDECDCD